MTTLRDRRPILGIDPTHDGVAFVFLEDGAPVDWGTWRDDGRESSVFERLVADYAPQVIVLEDPAAAGCERRARMRQLLRRLAGQATRMGLTVVKIPQAEVRRTWRASGVTRKQAAAVRIARLFPDLEPLLPQPRHHSREVPRERLFGTLALVLHAFGVTDERGADATSPNLRAAS